VHIGAADDQRFVARRLRRRQTPAFIKGQAPCAVLGPAPTDKKRCQGWRPGCFRCQPTGMVPIHLFATMRCTCLCRVPGGVRRSTPATVVATWDAVTDMECRATSLLCFLWHCWSVRSHAVLMSSLIQTMDVQYEAHSDDMGGFVDQDDLSSGLAMAVSHHLQLLQLTRRVRACQLWRRRHRGSVRARAFNKKRDFNLGLRNILRDYWGVHGEPPVFDKADFESLFQMPRAVFMRVYFDNTLSPPHLVGGRASQTVSPGSPVGEYPPRKNTPISTHARRRPGGGAPSDRHELCDWTFTFLRSRTRGNTHASPSYPVRSPQTLRKPPSDTLKGPSENLPLRAQGARLSGGQPKLRIPP